LNGFRISVWREFTWLKSGVNETGSGEKKSMAFDVRMTFCAKPRRKTAAANNASKDRKLTYDDLTHYQHVVSALNETVRLMSEIDEANRSPRRLAHKLTCEQQKKPFRSLKNCSIILSQAGDMATDPKQLYVDTISHLSAKERLQLAGLILEDLAASREFDDAWSEQDLRDLAAFSLFITPTHEQDNEAS
jgi:hypothetical protein